MVYFLLTWFDLSFSYIRAFIPSGNEFIVALSGSIHRSGFNSSFLSVVIAINAASTHKILELDNEVLRYGESEGSNG